MALAIRRPEASDREIEQAIGKAAAELADDFWTTANVIDAPIECTRKMGIVGGITFLAGGAAAVAGGALVPFTGGASLTAISLGVSLMAGGGVAVIGSKLVELIVSQLQMDELERKISGTFTRNAIHKMAFPCSNQESKTERIKEVFLAAERESNNHFGAGLGTALCPLC